MNDTLHDFLQTGDLFGAINILAPLPFITDANPAKLNILLDDMYGQRKLYSSMKTKSVDDVAELVVILYKDAWDKLILIEAIDFDIGGGATRKMTETITENENRNNTRNDVNKVTAYNSDVMIDNDGLNSIGTEGLDKTRTRTVSDGQYSIQTAFNDLQLITKTNIITTAIKDVADYMTLIIY